MGSWCPPAPPVHPRAPGHALHSPGPGVTPPSPGDGSPGGQAGAPSHPAPCQSRATRDAWNPPPGGAASLPQPPARYSPGTATPTPRALPPRGRDPGSLLCAGLLHPQAALVGGGPRREQWFLGPVSRDCFLWAGCQGQEEQHPQGLGLRWKRVADLPPSLGKWGPQFRPLVWAGPRGLAPPPAGSGLSGCGVAGRMPKPRAHGALAHPAQRPVHAPRPQEAWPGPGHTR